VISLGLIVAILGLIKSFSINYAMMITLETLEASLAVSLFNIPFVLGMFCIVPNKIVGDPSIRRPTMVN